ncbi:MAG TPA: aspartate--tRNA ligase [Mycoplasmatales bacterium]|jgi:aspartyl-tRNA synthetase|nr:aspartate--tRNA ligase [Mycoplasmatales bacterium]
MEKKIVNISGWIIGVRNLGKITFLVIRDGNGKNVQIVIKKKNLIKEINENLKNGHLVKINGFYNDKIKGNNEHIKVEDKEILLTKWKLISKSSNLPFEIKDRLELKEENKYKYRYIDLRRNRSRLPIVIKSRFLKYIRNKLDNKGFIEIDTPILSQYSPEGAKSFIVPSNEKGKFYTLPQSPQIFKQILMISGFSKYYQIAKTFRNENARSNRQPEFLQLDIEFWFAKEKEIFKLVKVLLEKFLIKELNIDKKNILFKKLTFEKCLETYGSDKPDLRNPLIIQKSKNLRFILLNKDNLNHKVLKKIKDEIKIDRNAYIISKLNENIEIIYANKKITKNIKKFSKKNDRKDGIYIISNCKEKNNSLDILGRIRSSLSDIFIPKNQIYNFLWINNWPLFKKGNGKYESFRHPFTMPKKNYLKAISNNDSNKMNKMKCEAYDLVCNGEEIASGSLRINDWELQKKIFQILGFKEEEIEKYFGYFLKALSFAAPPHGGIGLGIERIIATFLNLKNLKETIPFPKNIDGSCSLTGTPN